MGYKRENAGGVYIKEFIMPYAKSHFHYTIFPLTFDYRKVGACFHRNIRIVDLIRFVEELGWICAELINSPTLPTSNIHHKNPSTICTHKRKKFYISLAHIQCIQKPSPCSIQKLVYNVSGMVAGGAGTRQCFQWCKNPPSVGVEWVCNRRFAFV